MKIRQLQSIEYVIKLFKTNVDLSKANENNPLKKSLKIIIKLDDQLWTGDFLEEDPNSKGSFFYEYGFNQLGMTQNYSGNHTIQNVRSQISPFQIEKDLFDNKLAGSIDGHYSQLHKQLFSVDCMISLFRLLRELTKNVPDGDDLPKILYNAKNITHEFNLPFLDLSDNPDIEWVSIITEEETN